MISLLVAVWIRLVILAGLLWSSSWLLQDWKVDYRIARSLNGGYRTFSRIKAAARLGFKVFTCWLFWAYLFQSAFSSWLLNLDYKILDQFEPFAVFEKIQVSRYVVVEDQLVNLATNDKMPVPCSGLHGEYEFVIREVLLSTGESKKIVTPPLNLCVR